jgi:hypothetical protein
VEPREGDNSRMKNAAAGVKLIVASVPRRTPPWKNTTVFTYQCDDCGEVTTIILAQI